MPTRRARRRASSLCIAAGLGFVGCGGAAETKQTVSTPTTTTESDAAHAVCTALREWENSLTEVANEASADATSAADAVDRAAALDRGFGELIGLVDDLAAPVRGLALPHDPRWNALRQDLLAGPAEADRELTDERARLAAVGPIEASDERGRIGQFFNALEKVFSVVEPALGPYADEPMRRAFAQDSDCDHVVQS